MTSNVEAAFNVLSPATEPTDPVERLVYHTRTLGGAEIARKPVPRECLAGLFPICSTTALVAMGGVGKTTLSILKAALSVGDFQTTFVSAEDGADDYQAKIHNAVVSKDCNGRRYNELDIMDVADNIHVLDLKGMGAKLIVEQGGSFVPSAFVDDLIAYFNNHFPNTRLVIFETVSRFAGGEDNDRMEAIVSACDRIAIGINGACGLVHHTGKQARQNVVDLYSGRGGSALGDNTRSMIVLTKISDDYPGENPIVASREDIEAGRVFEMKHVRNSYGVTVDNEYYVTRSGDCNGPVLESIPLATDGEVTTARLQALDAKLNKAATSVHQVISNEGGWVPRKYFDNYTKDKIKVTQREGRELIIEMLNAGSLAEDERTAKSGQKMNGLVIKQQPKGVSL